VRLRFLNGAKARIFHLAFGDRNSFYVIAFDGGYLTRTVETDILRLVLGERYEVLVDFSQGEKNVMFYTTAQDDGTGDKLPLMAFAQAEDLKNDIKTIPQSFDEPDVIASSRARRRRRFLIDDRAEENMKVMMTTDAGQGGHVDMHDMMHGSKSASQTGNISPPRHPVSPWQ